MANFTRIGFGQVEPNQLSAQKTGQIYASLPLDESVKVLQNGEFMYYSYADNKVTAEPTVEGQEPMLVFNEIKIYEDYLRLKDFAMIRVGDNYVTNPAAVGRVTQANYGWADGVGTYGDGSLNVPATINPEHSEYQAAKYRMDGFAPRMFKTNVGDIFTTNMVDLGTKEAPAVYAEKDILKLKKVTVDGSSTLVLSKTGDIDTIQFVVAKVYTMPDGQPGLKLQRIK